MKAVLLVLVLGSVSAFGQDDASMMAAQQASQLAMQAGLQAAQQTQQNMLLASQTALAMQQAMQASMQANQQMMQNMVDASNSCCDWALVNPPQPVFSVKSGRVKPGKTVRIRWRYTDHTAAVYYTTDGWTPTTASTRYTGPIPIESTTQLRAVSLGWGSLLSPIAHAEYTVPGPATPAPALALSGDGVLHAGTRLRLVTNSTINSKTARVGDTLSVLVDQDVKQGGVVVIARGTPVSAVLTVATPAARYSLPGDLVFEVHSINAPGKPISIRGGEILQGESTWRPTEAVIEPGMAFTVAVASDTPLKP